jgi:diaminopimelate decarboxylase
MDHFNRKNGELNCESISINALIEKVGSPAYVYSRATLGRHCEEITKAFSKYPTTPCFAVKANSNLSILKEIFSHGLGADLVSLGELRRALLAGVDPKKIVFSGVGKQSEEISEALKAGILSFNVESDFELEHISKIAEKENLVANICLRINPNINAKTHPKIATGLYSTKFGLTESIADELLLKISNDQNLNLIGLACHIGSQITDLKPLKEAASRMADIAIRLMKDGNDLRFINMGGGLGIRYKDEVPPELQDYANTLIGEIKRTKLKLIIEPGRVIAGNMGVLVTKVIGVKKTPEKHFVVVDAAMNDLCRPSVYDAYHEIQQVSDNDEEIITGDIVGPICETGDYLAKDRELARPNAGDLLVVRSCGAYGATMASNYNSRARVVEVLVDDSEFQIIRKREPLESLWQSEMEALK